MTIYEKLTRYEKQLTYANEVLNRGGLELWEAKEYTALQIESIEKIQDLKEQIKEYETLYFN